MCNRNLWIYITLPINKFVFFLWECVLLHALWGWMDLSWPQIDCWERESQRLKGSERDVYYYYFALYVDCIDPPIHPWPTHPPTQSNTLYRIGVQIWYNSIICIYFAYDSKWESSFPWTIFLVSIETRLVLQNGFFWTETLCLFFLFGFYMT